MRWFEDLTPGRVDWWPTTYVVTEQEIVDVGRRWDPQPFHTDPVAAEASIFGGLVAATVHLFAMLEALGARVAEDDQISAVATTETVHLSAEEGGSHHAICTRRK